MRHLIKYSLPFVFVSAISVLASSAVPSASRVSQSPLFFEQANEADSSVKYFSRGPNYLFGIAGDHAEIVLAKASVQNMDDLPGRGVREYDCASVRKLVLDFAGSNPNAAVSGASELSRKVNYFIGNDPTQWRTAPMFSNVRVSELYPGISMVYYGNGRQFEYDFDLQPGADPGQISIRINGADALRLDAQGGLVIDLAGEQIRQAPPQIYQLVNGVKQPVSGHYQIEGGNIVRIKIDEFNRGIPLTIDPQLVYSSYFGGNFGDRAYSIKVDPAQNIYIAGQTLSTAFLFTTNLDFLPEHSFVLTNRGGKINGDAFVARLSTDPALPPAYFTYLGGTGNDGANDLAIDPSAPMHAFITGFTGSPDFPTWPTNFFTAAFNGLSNNIAGSRDPHAHIYPTDVFVTELDTAADGLASLAFSACIGGTRADVGIGIALNDSGEIFLTGYTDSTNFPTFNGFQTNGIDTVVVTNQSGVLKTNRYARTNDAFVVKLTPTGGVLYSSYLGGTNKDVGQGIAALGELAFVTGYTASTNFPVTPNNAWQTNLNGSSDPVKQFHKKVIPLDAFIAEFDTSLTGQASLLFNSYFGGSNSDSGYRVVVDPATNVYITGNTSSRDFPRSTNADLVAMPYGLATTNVINYDAILAKFDFSDPLNPKPVWSFSFGGKSDDVGWDLALDTDGGIYVVGATISSKTNFPTSPANILIHPLTQTNAGVADVFVTAFTTNAASLVYSCLLGSKLNDYGFGIAVDANKNAYITGETFNPRHNATNFPAVFNAAVGPFQPQGAGTNDAFVSIISTNSP